MLRDIGKPLNWRPRRTIDPFEDRLTTQGQVRDNDFFTFVKYCLRWVSILETGYWFRSSNTTAGRDDINIFVVFFIFIIVIIIYLFFLLM